MDNNSDLSRAFRLRRQVLRMSLSELAARSGVSHATVQRILSGVETTSRFDNLMAIANEANVEWKLADFDRIGARSRELQAAWKLQLRIRNQARGARDYRQEIVDACCAQTFAVAQAGSRRK